LASGDLTKEQRRELKRLFEFVVDEAGTGNSWPSSVYVANVQAVIDGETLIIDEEEDDDE